MDRAKEFYWNEAIKYVQDYHANELEFPVQSYFYIEHDILCFKQGMGLPKDVQQIIELAFKAVYWRQINFWYGKDIDTENLFKPPNAGKESWAYVT